jgi:peptidoglycan/xylan/chitin deacetylase (PgdA/CDA1 family)
MARTDQGVQKALPFISPVATGVGRKEKTSVKSARPPLAVALLFLLLHLATHGPVTSASAPALPATSVDVPILMYHYLTASSTPPNEYTVTQDEFVRQMSALVAYGYETVTFHDFMDYRYGRAAPPAHPVILTFDDGHRSVYEIARPVLEDRSMQATFFVTTGFVGESEDDREGNWMVWDPEINTLYSTGFPIESHSVTHPRLTDVSLLQAWHELVDSRLDIEAHLGNQVSFFCYPGGYGADDPQVRTLVQQTGYQAAVAAWPEGIANAATSDIWALPRVMISDSDSVDLDLGHPGSFFMRKLDPGFPLPRIAIDAVRFKHADGTFGACFNAGETIALTVLATNLGAAVNAQLSLALDDDAVHSDPYHSQAVPVYLASGATETASLLVQLPDDLAPGLHSYAVRFQDEYSILGFKDSGWQPAFLLAGSCYHHDLPAIMFRSVHAAYPW